MDNRSLSTSGNVNVPVSPFPWFLANGILSLSSLYGRSKLSTNFLHWSGYRTTILFRVSHFMVRLIFSKSIHFSSLILQQEMYWKTIVTASTLSLVQISSLLPWCGWLRRDYARCANPNYCFDINLWRYDNSHRSSHDGTVRMDRIVKDEYTRIWITLALNLVPNLFTVPVCTNPTIWNTIRPGLDNMILFMGVVIQDIWTSRFLPDSSLTSTFNATLYRSEWD